MHHITKIAASLLIAVPAAAAFAQGAGAGGGQGAVSTGATGNGSTANGSTSTNLGNPTGQAQLGTSTNAQVGNSGVTTNGSIGASGSTNKASRSSTPTHPTEKATGTGNSPETNSGTSPTGGAAGGK